MTFEYTPTDDGFRIRDTIENAWTDVAVGRRVQPPRTGTSEFRVPLDDAITVEATELAFSQNFETMARDPEGSIVKRVQLGESATLPTGSYELDTTITPCRLYLLVSGAHVTIDDSPDGTYIAFDAPTTVTIGVRSHHQRPAGVVTAAQDPRDLMAAISSFGSAMKTFSPERSFPTLRGHPPELAVRGQTNISDEFAPPDTGITVEVPPEYAAAFTATPLAYYFGATITPGFDPRFIAGDAVHELDTETLAEGVHELIRHNFVLDTIVRTVGIYPYDMAIADALEPHLDARAGRDRQSLYDLPLDERTAAYLDIPFEATRDLLTWPVVADVDPIPLNAESLPYLAYRMAAIRSPSEGTVRHGGCCAPDDDPGVYEHAGSPVRSFTPGEPDHGNSSTFVDPAPFDAHHNIWVGDGLPTTGSKPTLGSYLRSTEAAPHDGRITVHVVSMTDTDHSRQRSICGQYSSEGFEVTHHENPTQSELKDIIMTDIDLLHYCGDVSDEGLECIDGPLDVRILPRSGVSAFFLDGECSYRQGLALVRVGSIGGVVTTSDERLDEHHGRRLASLLDYGFSLTAAVDILTRITDHPLTIVGDGDHQVCKSQGLPYVLITQPGNNTTNSVTLTALFYQTMSQRIGSVIGYMSSVSEAVHLTGAHTAEFTHDSFLEYADRAEAPIIADSDLLWPSDYTPAALLNLVR